ncbi:MAG: nucleotide exchange factor GrpE [Acetivibrionales bacterium]|jgi:molecular chaperone GrpE
MGEKRHQEKTGKHGEETHEATVLKKAGTDTGSGSEDAGVPAAAGGRKNAAACGRENDETDAAVKNVSGAASEPEEATAELEKVKLELENKTRQCEDYFDKLQRTAAEFDNFKRRSLKEKEALYADAVTDVVGAFIPVIDNVERAIQAISSNDSSQSLKEGVEMIYRQFKDVLKNIGVEEIKAFGEQFDPNFHNAAMHVEDDSVGRNVIVEEFQKGYIYKDRVIRYSMVKVAN